MKSFQPLSSETTVSSVPHELSTEPKFLLSPDMGVFFSIMYKGLCRINDCDIAPLSAHVLHIYSTITSCIVDALSVVPC